MELDPETGQFSSVNEDWRPLRCHDHKNLVEGRGRRRGTKMKKVEPGLKFKEAQVRDFLRMYLPEPIWMVIKIF